MCAPLDSWAILAQNSPRVLTRQTRLMSIWFGMFPARFWTLTQCELIDYARIKAMPKLMELIFGDVEFRASEEHQQFQYRFLIVLLLSGAIFTSLFLIGNYSEINRLQGWHLYSMTAFTLSAVAFWSVLRGHRRRLYWVAWFYEACCLLEYLSALMFVPQDELRILWFYINIPGVYIMLGQRAGLIVTVLTLAILVTGNAHLAEPYSPNAMATALISMVYLALFFHIYVDRSMSYYQQMSESNRKLHHLAMHDTLTGVFNARAYYEICDQMIRVAKRNHSAYAVLFVDLDHFKSINDSYGHAAGDLVLKAVAQCLWKKTRDSDALGRIGGEEFSLFLPNTDLAGALDLAESIRASIEELMPSIGERNLRVTASIGVASNHRRDRSMQEIQQEADQAMYQAKAQGRNRVSTLSRGLDEPAVAPSGHGGLVSGA